MKKLIAILTAAVLCLLLCACGGSTRQPYLTEEERTRIEQALNDNLKLLPPENDYNTNSLGVELTNPTEYDLYDVRVILSGENSSMLFYYLPAGSTVRQTAYFGGDREFASGQAYNVELRYTIGAYTYTADQVRHEVAAGSIVPEIVVQTTEGERILKYGERLDLEDVMVEGLRNVRIQYLEITSYSKRSDGTCYSLNIEGEANTRSSSYITYSSLLRDETGLVLDANYCSVSSGSGSLHIYVYAPLSQGRYYLDFQEKK